MDEVTSSVENIDAVTRVIRVTIPSKSVDTEYQKSLERVQQRASIKGFRPGKAPRQLVATLYGDQVKSEVAEKLVSSSFDQVVKQNSLEVVGRPEIEGGSVEPGKSLEYKARVAIFPRPEVKQYESFAVRVGKRPVAEKDLENVIERMRESKATPRKLEFRTTAQSGDVIDAAVVSTLEGEEPGRAEPISVQLGSDQLSAELSEGIIGMSVGDTKVIHSTISEQHRDEKLRGKKVTYQVTLNGLSERVLPELTDEFAKTLELDVGTVLELRMKVRQSLEEEAENQARVDAEAALLEQLVAENPFEVPQVLIDEEIRALIMRSGLVDPKRTDVRQMAIEPFREGLQEVALKRVRSAILVDRISELEKIKAEEDEVKARIKEIAEENNVPEDEVRKFLAREGRLMNVMLEIGRTKTMKFLHARAKIEYFEQTAEEAEVKA